MTLDEMYVECAAMAEVEIIKTGGSYIGDYLTIVNKFKSGINYAKNQIANRKYAPGYKENKTLGAALTVDVTTLTKTFKRITRVENSLGQEIFNFRFIDKNTIYFPDNNSGDILTIQYEYIPADLTLLTDVLDFPVSIIDPLLLCNFAVFYYFNMSSDEVEQYRAPSFLAIWTDGFESIRINTGESTSIKDYYNTSCEW